MYIRASEKAFTAANIKSGWRDTALEPLSPILVLDKHQPAMASTPSSPHTSARPTSLDLTLLDSFAPHGKRDNKGRRSSRKIGINRYRD